MTELTRRRDSESAREKWSIFYDDICIDSIGLRAGVPNHADQWEWKCGFHPGCDRLTGGPVETFELAHTAFEAEWQVLLPTLTEAPADRTYSRQSCCRARPGSSRQSSGWDRRALARPPCRKTQPLVEKFRE
ncbi:hypothetical protein ACE103_30025 [Bradyrhizobium sp. ma5]|uniref:hypothetical protein n=1 Tax=Bradyrhizobium sp. ma5 TaxID=3344828 RepID=UPI0035D51ECD